MGFKYDERDDSAGKIFIGGLPRETTESSLVRHFQKYGEIIDKVIMMDKFTGQPRGFGFVTFSDPSLVDIVLQNSHTIHGKIVEIKRTIPRRNSGQFYNNDNNNSNSNLKTKKVFVGGIPITLADDEFGDFFMKYGEITDYQIIKNHETNRSRGFGFVVFESEESVDFLLSNGNMINLYGSQVEVKRAEPKKSSNFQPKTRSFGKNEYNNGFDNQTGFDNQSGFGPVMKNPTRLVGRLSYNNNVYNYLTDPLVSYTNGYYYNSGFGSVLSGYGQVNPFYAAGTTYGLSGSGGAGYGIGGTGYGSNNGGRYHPYGR